jgi:hypothetical protein
MVSSARRNAESGGNIDFLVYQLYALTDAEIALVESVAT